MLVCNNLVLVSPERLLRNAQRNYNRRRAVLVHIMLLHFSVQQCFEWHCNCYFIAGKLLIQFLVQPGVVFGLRFRQVLSAVKFLSEIMSEGTQDAVHSDL